MGLVFAAYDAEDPEAIVNVDLEFKKSPGQKKKSLEQGKTP